MFKIESETENYCEIKIKQPKGKLPPFSITEVIFELKSSQIGKLNRLLIPCYVEDMVEPLFLDVQGIVKGPSVMYSFTEKPEFKLVIVRSEI